MPTNSHLQTVIFLVRHGQTDRVYSNDQSIDGKRILTQEGRRQIEKVSTYLRPFAPTAIYSSPLERTKECAEIIKHVAEIPAAIEERSELVEVYSASDYRSIATRIPKFFNELVEKHGGAHVVCVSHQDVIQGGLDCFDLTEAEKDYPCHMGELYRLVFADSTLVECQKLKPAHAV